MKFSLNCLFLGEASDQSIPVIIGEEIIVDNNRIKYKDITVSNVKSLILSQRKIDCSLNNLKLWIVDRVSIDKNDEMLEKFSTEDDIKEKLGGELMNPRNFLSKYFNENSFNDDESKSAVHIIVQLLTTTGYPNKRPRLDFDNIPIDLSLPPTQLLHGTGYYWDYQEPPELENILRSEILTLYDLFKNNDRDKSNTPIFFMISGAGCGKSRNATELPNVLRRIFKDHSDLGPRLLNALVFNIPLENGTLLNTREEIKANVAIAKRMLYQIRTHQMISWAQIREDTQTLLIDDVLMRCANQKNVALKELTVILIIDGLQVALENINYGMNKSSLFYSFMTDIALLATNNESPLVIACCTATLARPFNEMIATSHQKRIFLPICSLRPPERDGKPIFEDTPLHNMLISDMGGNGRALEALELALKGIDFKNTNFASIAQKVFDQLQDRYIEWISLTRYLTPVLRAIMTHTTLVASDPIPGTNILPEDLSKLGLVKFEKDHESNDKGTLTCPYIWLWLMANTSSEDKILLNWNFKYYNELQADRDPTIPPGCQFWQHFEHFIASFRVLKSNVFKINEKIKLQDIHAGAKHNFGTDIIKNVPLSLEKATQQQSTKSSAYSANKTVTCKRGDNQININLENASNCIINGSNAPAGDSFCAIRFANSSQLHIESHQCTCLRSETVNQDMFDKERRKASDEDDIFILYTCGRSNVENLPSLSAIVDRDCWKSYFGPFVGRAFHFARSDKFNINNCTRSELTSISGIGVKRAEVLESLRPYSDLEDCFNKTRISRKFLVNFRFD